MADDSAYVECLPQDLLHQTSPREWDVTLCADQPGWLSDASERGLATSLAGLIENCNRREDKQAKQAIFMTPKCRRCSQATTGGKKVVCKVVLRQDHADWISMVRQRCGHPDNSKTLRILVDYYGLGQSGGLKPVVTQGLELLLGRVQSAPPTTPRKRRRTPSPPRQPPPGESEEEEEEVNLFTSRPAVPAPGSQASDPAVAVPASEYAELLRLAKRDGHAFRHLTLRDRHILLLVLPSGEVHCTDSSCPHQGAPLQDIEECAAGPPALKCRRHDRVFCVTTGVQKCAPEDACPRQLRIHKAVVDADGAVSVTLSDDPLGYASDAYSTTVDDIQSSPPPVGVSEEYFMSPAGRSATKRRRLVAEREHSSLSQDQSFCLSQGE